jgi:hypothetical protein
MSAIALGSAREEPGGPVQSSHGLFDAAADAKRWYEESKREHREQLSVLHR